MKAITKSCFITSAVVLLLTLAACEGNQPSGNGGSLPENSLLVQQEDETDPSKASIDNCDKLVITWFVDNREYSAGVTGSKSVEVVDPESIGEIISTYQSLKYTETSRPMGFPRYFVQFLCDGRVIAHFFISPTNVDNSMFIISGSELGLGNKELTSSVMLELIDELYKSPYSYDE